ncbi:TIGR04283 family arsenosugar biosynthesis glycosyltransferase [Candidatus Omnitrophota bacterium]
MISIIIPAFNEEKILSENFSHFENLSKKAEIIVACGESSDRTESIIRGIAKVIPGETGRAVQMNEGALKASGEVLLFLHADAFISPETLDAIESLMQGKEVAGGCLTQRIDKAGRAIRLLEGFGNTRARLTKVFYGDQGIFVRKNVFLEVGTYPQVPIMEDVMFTKKLKRKGKTCVLSDKITVSPRRIEKEGVFRTVLIYSLLNVMFWLKFPLEKIKKVHGDLR